jgi:hypothetical protein
VGGALALGPVAMKVPKKRGRPRKYGPDGSLIRPLNATPISASAPMAAAVAAGQYTPASAVGAAMKRGRGRPLDFAAAAGKQHQHHQLHHHHHQQHHQPFGFHFDSIGTSLRSFSPMFFSTIFFGVNPQTVPEKKVGFSLSLFSRGIREWAGRRGESNGTSGNWLAASPLTPCHDTVCVCPSLIRIFLVSSDSTHLVLHDQIVLMVRDLRLRRLVGGVPTSNIRGSAGEQSGGQDGGISCLNLTPICCLLPRLLGVLWWGSAVVVCQCHGGAVLVKNS